VFVKVCGITSAKDAVAAVDAGVDAIGLVFADSPRRVPIETAAAIVGSISPFVRCVGVFQNAPPDDVLDVVHRAGLAGVQLHGTYGPDDIAVIRSTVPFVMWACAAESPDVAIAERWRADAVLIDAARPGSGTAWDWSRFGNPSGVVRVVLAGGLSADNVGAGIAALRPWGVDASSALEHEPGVKDHELMWRFVAAARAGGSTLTTC